MKVHQIQVGNMQNFTYIVEDDETNEAIIIDPSWDLVELELIIKKNFSNSLNLITDFLLEENLVKNQ